MIPKVYGWPCMDVTMRATSTNAFSSLSSFIGRVCCGGATEEGEETVEVPEVEEQQQEVVQQEVVQQEVDEEMWKQEMLDKTMLIIRIAYHVREVRRSYPIGRSMSVSSAMDSYYRGRGVRAVYRTQSLPLVLPDGPVGRPKSWFGIIVPFPF